MMMIFGFGEALTSVLLLLALPASVQSKDERIEPSPKQMAKLQALTPEGVAAAVDVRDDDLETVATLTTAKAYRDNGKFTDPVRSDNFFRALIDKRSGRVTFQLYQTVTYNFVARDFTSVNYATKRGPQNAKIDVLEHKIGPCMGGGCVYLDTLAFDVSAEQMKEIVASYAAGNSTMWRFKFQSRAGSTGRTASPRRRPQVL